MQIRLVKGARPGDMEEDSRYVNLQFAAILILVQQSIFEISSVLLRLLQNLLRLHVHVLHKLNAMKFFQKQNNSLNNTANCHSSAKSR